MALTVIAHGYASIHGIADEGHYDTKESKKDPIFTKSCTRVLPDESQQCQEFSAKRTVSRLAELLCPYLVELLTGGLIVTQPPGLFLCVLAKILRIAAIHLRITSPTLINHPRIHIFSRLVYVDGSDALFTSTYLPSFVQTL
jgi:hypothetical protein